MGIVPTNKLKPGLTLAEDARDVNGQLILAKGIKIQLLHIKKLKTWGVTEVNIYDDITLKDELQLNDNSETIERTKERLKFVFSHNDLEHPAVKEIFRLSLEYRSRNNRIEKEEKLVTNQKKPIENNQNIDFLEA